MFSNDPYVLRYEVAVRHAHLRRIAGHGRLRHETRRPRAGHRGPSPGR